MCCDEVVPQLGGAPDSTVVPLPALRVESVSLTPGSGAYPLVYPGRNKLGTARGLAAARRGAGGWMRAGRAST
ncbi:hypothetical protein EBF04_12910 [Streptomyces sp. I6]|nr:hypothetical protein EBF04_12910 [Streptomyces sp. I6]